MPTVQYNDPNNSFQRAVLLLTIVPSIDHVGLSPECIARWLFLQHSGDQSYNTPSMESFYFLLYCTLRWPYFTTLESQHVSLVRWHCGSVIGKRNYGWQLWRLSRLWKFSWRILYVICLSLLPFSFSAWGCVCCKYSVHFNGKEEK